MTKLISIMLVVFILALGVSTLPANAANCMSAMASVLECRLFLESPGSVAPGARCCDSVRNLAIRIAEETIDAVCKCLRPNTLSSGFLVSKAQQLPSLCNLGSSSFHLIVDCLALAERTFTPFLPPFNIPALAPFFSPFIHHSPSTPNTPPPPSTPDTPPSENQGKFQGSISTNTFNIPPWVPDPFLQPEIPNIPIPAPPVA